MSRKWLLFVLIFVAVPVFAESRREILAELPPGFRLYNVVSGLDRPTDFVFLSETRLLLTEHGTGNEEFAEAAVKLVDNGVVRPNPVLTLSVTRRQDSGLLAIALDPDFEQNGWLYLWYTPGVNALNYSGLKMRLSRFTWDHEAELADPASEQILLESEKFHVWHHGNALAFDDQGNLLVAVGELTPDEDFSQDMTLIEGKLLRIRPTEEGYSIPDDNPFVDDPAIRPEIYASGLRNPYVMTRRASDGLVAIGDVGGLKYEEINLLASGADFGWPVREGICPRGLYDPCEPASAEFTDPAIYWRHDLPPIEGEGAITGLTFYEGTQFPEEYRGKLFYVDLIRAFVRVGDPLTGETMPFADNVDPITRLRSFNGQLFYMSIYTGELNAIYYEDGTNVAPTVELNADVQFGTPPLRVVLSAEATDPDDVLLRYKWDFGDGSPAIESAESSFVHVYPEDGIYTPSVTVIDGRGAESLPATQQLTVYSGEWPRLFVTNHTDPSRTLYHAGDTVAFRAERSTLEGLDPETPFTWDIVLHHGTHTHIALSAIDAISSTFTIPTTNHDGDADLHYAFHMTMHTLDGMEITQSKQMEPLRTELTFDTSPVPHRILLNDVETRTPVTIEAIVGIENEAVALPNMFFESGFYTPQQWMSQGKSIVQGTTLRFFAPAESQTYIADYLFDRPGVRSYAPLITR